MGNVDNAWWWLTQLLGLRTWLLITHIIRLFIRWLNFVDTQAFLSKYEENILSKQLGNNQFYFPMNMQSHFFCACQVACDKLPLIDTNGCDGLTFLSVATFVWLYSFSKLKTSCWLIFIHESQWIIGNNSNWNIHGNQVLEHTKQRETLRWVYSYPESLLVTWSL